MIFYKIGTHYVLALRNVIIAKEEKKNKNDKYKQFVYTVHRYSWYLKTLDNGTKNKLDRSGAF